MFRRTRASDDFDEEIKAHLELETDELVSEGLSEEQAHRKARVEFGSVPAAQERFYVRNRVAWLDNLVRDLKYAMRQLRKSPAFTITAVLTISFAVGANTAVFSLMNAILLRSLPVHDPQQLVVFKEDSGDWPVSLNNSGYSGYEFSYPLLERFRQQQRVFSDVFGYASLGFKERNVVLRRQGQTMEATGTMVTGGFFRGLGIAPALGRAIDESDLAPSAALVAVISYTSWQNNFAASPSVLGQQITLNNIPYTIVGVASRGFTGVQTGIMDDLWIPISRTPALGPWGVGQIDESPTSEHWWWLSVIGRLRPGVNKEQAAAALNVQLISTMTSMSGGKRFGKQPFMELEDGRHGMQFYVQRDNAQPAKLLMGLVVLVLFAACGNLATLLLARASARNREIAVRLAIGASPARIWRQLLTESLLLSITGGMLGILIAPAATHAIATVITARGSDQLALDLTMDHRVLFFTAILSVLTGLCFGVAPAWRSSRIDVNSSLKDGSAAESIRSRLPMRALIVAQAAISTMLLIVCGIFLHSLSRLRSQATGFDQGHLLVFHLEPSQSGYTGPQLPSLYATVQQRLAALPGVRSVTTIGNRLISGWQNNFDVQIEGYTPPNKTNPNVLNNSAGAHFLATAGIPLIMGRDFTDSDTLTSPKVAIVNEALARKYFGNRSPIGYHLTFQTFQSGKKAEAVVYTIVGVCGDALYTSLRKEAKPTWYQAISQVKTVNSVHFMLRTDGDPAALTPSVMMAIRGVDSRLLATDVKTQSEQIDDSLGSERMFAQLSTFFGLLATLLAAIGLYGTLAYSVARRQRELGIRLALGAQRGRLLRLVLSQGLSLVLAGILVGWLASALAGRLLASMVQNVLFHVRALDLLSFVGAAALLSTIAAIAAFIPARRAAAVDPMQALRTE